MLRTWQISNFKSIRTMDKPLEFAPLTVFCGANSSGKSSLLQSILLFKQTLQKNNPGPRIALNGELVQLGSLDDIISDGADGEISCVFQIANFLYKRPEGSFGRYKPGILGKKDPLRLTECRIFIGDPKKARKIFNRYPLVTGIRITNISTSKVLVDCSYIKEGDMPFPVGGDFLLKGEAVFDKQLSPESWMDVPMGMENIKDTLPDLQKKFYAGMRGKIAYRITDAFDHFFPNLTFDNNKSNLIYQLTRGNIRRFFCDNLYYVGPLRADPTEHRNTTSQDRDVGYRGEHFAECYAFYMRRLKIYPFFWNDKNPDKITDEDKIKIIFKDLADGGPGKKNYNLLETSFFEWLKYLEVADKIDIDNNGEIIVKQGKQKGKRLSNVGVGVSQVLPIILQCIVAEPGSTIIIEQPELHLHPKTQSRLADFFLVMSLLGKQIIIETHSEYIIDKLRLRIVQAPGDSLVDKVAVYFAEKKGGNSEFRRIRINEYSAMSEWPEGFFEDSVQIARDIMFAIRQKREETGGDGDDDD